MTEPSTPPVPHIYAAMNAVMRDVTAVGKEGYNKEQGYPFRGIDGVIDAVGPAFRTHGVVPTFEVVSQERRTYQSKRGATMMESLVKVNYEFSSMVDGSKIVCRNVPGEAADSGDKSLSKAMSVAYRIALIQALALPTHAPDPDESQNERAATSSEQEPTGPPLATSAQTDEIFDYLQKIDDREARVSAKRAFKGAFGDLAALEASKVPAVWKWFVDNDIVSGEPDSPPPPLPAVGEVVDATGEEMSGGSDLDPF